MHVHCAPLRRDRSAIRFRSTYAQSAAAVGHIFRPERMKLQGVKGAVGDATRVNYRHSGLTTSIACLMLQDTVSAQSTVSLAESSTGLQVKRLQNDLYSYPGMHVVTDGLAIPCRCH